MKTARVWILLIMLAAAAFRLFGLAELPPGLEHDEVAHWMINQEILSGQHGVYFTEAYGHEAGFHYVQAGFGALVGDHPLGLRLPSAYCGLLVVAIGYTLARRLFGIRVALVNAGALAVLFWPVFFSRLAVRAISLPVVSGLAVWFFIRGIGWGRRQKEHSVAELSDRGRRIAFLTGGALAGVALYTYMAARALPLAFGILVVYMAVKRRPEVKRHWAGLALFFVAMGVVAAPLVTWLWLHPGAEFRIGEIDQPLNSLLAGNPRPVLQNAVELLGFFGWRGDPLVRQGLPGRPVFDPVGAVLFYTGILLAILRAKRPAFAFVLIWLGSSSLPSLVTADAPSSIRSINGALFVGVPVGLAIEAAADLVGKVVSDLKRPRLAHAIVPGAVAVWLLMVAAGTARDFARWRQDSEVQFVWQTALRDAASYLDHDEGGGSVVVAGWTPESMDPPTMELFLGRNDLLLRYVNPMQALLFPEGGGRAVIPAILPLDSMLADELSYQRAVVERHASFLVYHLAPYILRPAQEEKPTDFEGGIDYLGAHLLAEQDGVALVSYWRAAGPVVEPLWCFVHLLDAGGSIVGQSDGLGAPAAHWRNGDLIVQVHHVAVPAGTYTIRAGLYNPETGQRRRFAAPDSAEDSLWIAEVTVP